MSQLQPSTDTADRWLYCCVCSNLLHDPVLLSCLDNCCRQCVDSIAQKDPARDHATTVMCPTCKELSVVTIGDTKEMNKNFFAADRVRQLSAADDAPSMCDMCKEDPRKSADQQQPAELYCGQCNKTLCSQCQHWHGKFVKGHAIVPLAASYVCASAGASAQCYLHRKNYGVFCSNCCSPKCPECELVCIEAKHSLDILQPGSLDDHVKAVKEGVQNAQEALTRLAESVSEYAQPVDRPDSAQLANAVVLLANRSSALDELAKAYAKVKDDLDQIHEESRAKVLDAQRSAELLGFMAGRADAYSACLLSSADSSSILHQRHLLVSRLRSLKERADAALRPTSADICVAIEAEQDVNAFAHLMQKWIGQPCSQADTSRTAHKEKSPTLGSESINRDPTVISDVKDAVTTKDRPVQLKTGKANSDTMSKNSTATQLVGPMGADTKAKAANDCWLYCCVCSNLLRDPVLLSCLDNCCRQCVDSIAQRDSGRDTVTTVTCPACREFAEITVCDTRELNANAFAADRVRQLSGAADAASICDMCKEDPKKSAEQRQMAQLYCGQCDKALCEQCQRWHVKFSKDHAVEALTARASTAGASASTAAVRCCLHGKALEFSCSQCSSLKCAECTQACFKDGHPLTALEPDGIEGYVTVARRDIEGAREALRGAVISSGEYAGLLDELDAAQAASEAQLLANRSRAADEVNSAHSTAKKVMDEAHLALKAEAADLSSLAELLRSKAARAIAYSTSVLTSADSSVLIHQGSLLVSRLISLRTTATSMGLRAAALPYVTIEAIQSADAIGNMMLKWLGRPRLNAEMLRADAEKAVTLRAASSSGSSAVSADGVEDKPVADRWMYCCVCTNLLRDPILLSCLDNCCRRCLDSIARKDPQSGLITVVNCPVCKAFARVTVSGTLELNMNAFAADRVRQLSAVDGMPPVCDMCKDDPKKTSDQRPPAELYCDQCNQALCMQCQPWHAKFNKNHAVGALATTRSGVGSAEGGVAMCLLHRKSYEFSCSRCCDVKCSECKQACTKAQHALAELKSGDLCKHVEALRKDVEEALKAVDQAPAPVAGYAQLVGELDVARAAHAQRLQANRQSAIDELNKAFDKAKDRLEHTYDDVKAKALLKQESADLLCAMKDRASSYCAQLLASSDVSSLIHQHRLLRSRLSVLRKRSISMAAPPAAGTLVTLETEQQDNVFGSAALKWIGEPREHTESLLTDDESTVSSAADALWADDKELVVINLAPAGKVLTFKESCMDVAVSPDGQLFLAMLGGSSDHGLKEYDASSGNELSHWLPPKFDRWGYDWVWTVAALDDGRVAAGVVYSKCIYILRRSPAASDSWLRDKRIDVKVYPWRVSVSGSVLAVVGGRLMSPPGDKVSRESLVPSSELYLLSLAEASSESTKVTVGYDILGLALTADAVVVSSALQQTSSRNVDQCFVVDAFRHIDGQRLWRYENSDGCIHDMCASDRVVYLAVYEKFKLVAVREGKKLSDVLNMEGGTESTSNPICLSLQAGELKATLAVLLADRRRISVYHVNT